MSRIVTLVLPFAAEECDAHEQAIAAACAMRAATGGGVVDILQIVPEPGAVPARSSDPMVRWWEIVSPSAVEADTPEALADVVVQALLDPALAAETARLILVPAAPLSEHTAALLAEALGGATLGRCSELGIDGSAVTATRLAFGSRLRISTRAEAALCCATWRADGGAAALQPLSADAVRSLHLPSREGCDANIEVLPSADRQARLEGARLVVSGGRGIGGPEGFELLARIAAASGGALGGSLPAVDAGWLPVARQVGVSGRFVTPRTYFAVGVSGTPQHLAGIATTTRIVAVNKDAEAPIFGVADVGAVADWRELLPLVLRHLESPQEN